MTPGLSPGAESQAAPVRVPSKPHDNASPSSSDARSIALRGARSAFGKSPKQPGFVANSHSRADGARAAATSVGSTRLDPNSDGRLLQEGRLAGASLGKGGVHQGPVVAAQRSLARGNMRTSLSQAEISAAPRSTEQVVSTSPSNIAALLASNRHSHGKRELSRHDGPSLQLETSSSTSQLRATRSNELPPTGIVKDTRTFFLNNRSKSSDVAEGIKQPQSVSSSSISGTTQNTSPAPVIEFLERSNNGTDGLDRARVSVPNYTACSPAILSPKPLRPLPFTGAPSSSASALAQKTFSQYNSPAEPYRKLSSESAAPLGISTHMTSANDGLNLQLPEVGSLSQANVEESEHIERQNPSDMVRHPPKQHPRASSSRKARTSQTMSSPSALNMFNPMDEPRTKPILMMPDTRSMKVKVQPAAFPVQQEPDPNVEPSATRSAAVSKLSDLALDTRRSAPPSTTGIQKNPSIRISPHPPSSTPTWIHDPLPLSRSQRRLGSITKRMTPQMTEDSLANAIVASSLASSRAPSPTKLPTPPLTRQRSKSRYIFHNHHDSRTPSPQKGMRQTMRNQSKSDDEDDDSGPTRRRKRHFIKKHPNKHHEGARKRWRDVVTERERKRYEGVWAANKGIHVPADGYPNRPLHPHRPSSIVAQSMVLNLVVRDIWSRSRLGNDALEEIWDLVDRKGIGLLDREEFVVGMWLIDQRLKGRKLPVRVSASVWDSVRALSGIKIPKNKT